MASINQAAAKDTAEAVHKISQISNKGVLNFLLIAIAVYFCIIMPINKLRQLSRAASGIKDQPNAPSPQDQTLQLLRQIADDIHQSKGADSRQTGTGLPRSQD